MQDRAEILKRNSDCRVGGSRPKLARVRLAGVDASRRGERLPAVHLTGGFLKDLSG